MRSNEVSEIDKFDNGEFSLEFENHPAHGKIVKAAPVAKMLGHRDATDLTRHSPEWAYVLERTPSDQQVYYLTQAGFLRAVGQRQLGRISDPTVRDYVERFQTWVFADVLPTILNTGSYTIPQAQYEALMGNYKATRMREEKGLKRARTAERKSYRDEIGRLEAQLVARDARGDARVAEALKQAAEARVAAAEAREERLLALLEAKQEKPGKAFILDTTPAPVDIIPPTPEPAPEPNETPKFLVGPTAFKSQPWLTIPEFQARVSRTDQTFYDEFRPLVDEDRRGRATTESEPHGGHVGFAKRGGARLYPLEILESAYSSWDANRESYQP